MRIRSCLLAAALAGCTILPPGFGPLAPIETEAVGPAYHAAGGQWDDGAAVLILLRAFERGGRVAFCGVRTVHSTTTRTLLFNDDVAGAAFFSLAGDRIHQGLGMLPEARYHPDMTGATARCYLTRQPWLEAYVGATPEIRLPRIQFGEFEDGSGSGGSVRFRQTPVNRPILAPPPPAA